MKTTYAKSPPEPGRKTAGAEGPGEAQVFTAFDCASKLNNMPASNRMVSCDTRGATGQSASFFSPFSPSFAEATFSRRYTGQATTGNAGYLGRSGWILCASHKRKTLPVRLTTFLECTQLPHKPGGVLTLQDPPVDRGPG